MTLKFEVRVSIGIMLLTGIFKSKKGDLVIGREMNFLLALPNMQ